MDFLKKEKLMFWCVVLLVLLNAVILTSLWHKRPHGGPPLPGGNGGGGRMMEEQLDLSVQQAQTFEMIREDHFHRSRPIHQGMHEIRLQVLDEIFAAEPNQDVIDNLTAQIGQEQARFDRALFQHMLELKNVCDENQASELKRMFADLLENTRPRNPGGPQQRPMHGPGPGHPPPPPR